VAEGGIIYTKTIDPSVQDGIDNNLIIQPNYAYQKRFNFGDDWNEIKLGIMLSYTSSVTDNNAPFSNNSNGIGSGGESNDTFNWIGMIKNVDPKVLPLDNSSSSFIGLRYDRLNDISNAGGFNNLNTMADTSASDNPYASYVTSDGANELSRSLLNSAHMIPLRQIDDTTLFATYLGMYIKINNKGAASQSVDIKTYRIGGTRWELNDLTDISLTNLKILINGNDVEVTSNTNITFNNGGVASPIPDSFFFYNAFLNIRPRIHTIAVKKIG
jgi:hypothetical protein